MLVNCLDAIPNLDNTISRYMLETIGVRLSFASILPLRLSGAWLVSADFYSLNDSLPTKIQRMSFLRCITP